MHACAEEGKKNTTTLRWRVEFGMHTCFYALLQLVREEEWHNHLRLRVDRQHT